MQQKPLALLLSVSFVTLAACTPAETTPNPPATGGVSGSGSGGSSSGSGGRPAGNTGGTPASGQGGQSGQGGTSGGTGGTPPAGGTGGQASGTGGSGPTSTGGNGPATGGTTGDAGGTPEAGGGDAGALAKFSFFYTSLAGMRRLSGSQNGFGGDLKYGTNHGLTGADKICQTLAADVGFGGKTWRAFLSVFKGPDGMPVNAIDRIGEGPWYDRRGRLIAMNKAGLLTANRPAGDSAAVNDMADETGAGKPASPPNDTHDVITGSNRMGTLRANKLEDTCMDWSSASVRGTVGMGHAWPAGSGMHWIQVHTEPNCAAGVNLVQNGPGNGSSIGAGGGWGGFYCFALTP